MTNITPRADVRQPCEYPGCPNHASHGILCRAHFGFVPPEISQPLLAAFKADDLASYNDRVQQLREFLKGLRGRS